MVTYAAEETRDPERTIPRALLVGVLIVTGCYVALNAAYFHVLPPTRSPDRIASPPTRPTRCSAAAAPRRCRRRCRVDVRRAQRRHPLRSARLPRDGARRTARRVGGARFIRAFDTPHRAIVLQGVWAIVLVATGTYRALFTRVVYTEWIFFALMAAGLMRLRAGRRTRPRIALGLSARAAHLHHLLGVHRHQSDRRAIPLESRTGLLSSSPAGRCT